MHETMDKALDHGLVRVLSKLGNIYMNVQLLFRLGLVHVLSKVGNIYMKVQLLFRLGKNLSVNHRFVATSM
jgi:hypothetical protein